MKDFKKIVKMADGGSVESRYQVWDESKMVPLSKEYKTSRGASKIAETSGGSVKDMSSWQPKYDYSKTGMGQDTGNYKSSSVRGSGGGAGYVPGTNNPFNPDSPLNRKKGGRVTKKVGTVKKNK
jgi:hypothetical protein